MVNFCFKVPLKYRIEALYHKKACLVLNDKIKDVPHQVTGKKISANMYYNLFIRAKTRLYKNRSTGYYSKHKDPRKDILNDPLLKKYLLTKIDEEDISEKLFNRQELKEVINYHFTERVDCTELILTLSSFFKFLDLFIKQKCNKVPEEVNSITASIPYCK